MRLAPLAVLSFIIAAAATSGAEPPRPGFVPQTPPASSAPTPPRRPGSTRIPVQVTGRTVTWSYLKLHQPQAVVRVLNEVAAGKSPRSSLAGLGSTATTDKLLKMPPQHAATTGTTGTTRGVARKGQTKQQAIAAPPSEWGVLTRTLLGAPDYAPTALKLGDAYDKDIKRASVWFTANTDGHITATIPTGAPFRISKIVSYDGSIEMTSLGPVMKPWDWRMSAPFELSVRAGQQFAVIVEFAPKFDLGTMMAGAKTGKLEVKDDKWTVNVPLSGMFNGVHVAGVVLSPTEDDLTFATTYYPTKNVPLPTKVQVFNLGNDPRTATISADSLPPGVTLDGSPSVALAPGEAKLVDIRFLMNGGPGFHGWDYGYGQPIVLRATAPGGLTSTTNLTMNILEGQHNWHASGTLLNVDFGADFTLFAQGHWHYRCDMTNDSLVIKDVDLDFHIYGATVATYTDALASATGIGLPQPGYGSRSSGGQSYAQDLRWGYNIWTTYADATQQKGTFWVTVANH